MSSYAHGKFSSEELEQRTLLTASVAGVDVSSTAWTTDFSTDTVWLAIDGDETVPYSGIDKLRLRFTEPVSAEADGTLEVLSPFGIFEGTLGSDVFVSADGLVAEWSLPRTIGAEFIGITSSAAFRDLDDGTVLPDLFVREIVLPGDVTGDAEIAFDDFLRLSAAFGESGLDLASDFDRDGVVGFADFLTLSSNFGAALEPGNSRLESFNLGELNPNNIEVRLANAIDQNDSDVYSFSLTEDSTVTINIQDVEQSTRFRLYRANTDTDGGAFDSVEVLEELTSVTGDRVITETLAGQPDGATYYLRVVPQTSSVSSSGYKLGFASQSILAADLRDPGASRSDAGPIDLASNSEITGVVTNGVDSDVYSFTLMEDSAVTINIRDVEESTRFRLYRANTDTDGGDFDSVEVLEEFTSVTGDRIMTETLAGHSDGATYYLRVTPQNNSNSGRYGLSFSSEALVAADLRDPGASRDDAGPIDLASDSEITGVVTNGVDSDVFSFTLTEDSAVTINIQDVEESTRFRLYRANTDTDGGDFDSVEILDEFTSVTGDRIMTETLAGHSDGATYYLRVTPQNNSNSGRYGLSFSSEALVAADLRDPGASRDDAGPIDLALNSEITGVITNGVDTDVYRFTLTEDSTVTINIQNVEESTRFRLYGDDRDGDGEFDTSEVLEELTSVTGNREVSVALMPGESGTTYYLRITPQNNSNSGSYEVLFSQEALQAAAVDALFEQ